MERECQKKTQKSFKANFVPKPENICPILRKKKNITVKYRQTRKKNNTNPYQHLEPT